MDKLVKDGRVAIVISPGYGAGWSTWNEIPDLEKHPVIAQMILDGQKDDLTEEFLKNLLGVDYICTLGLLDAMVEWVEEGERDEINEYDGHETLFIGPRQKTA